MKRKPPQLLHHVTPTLLRPSLSTFYVYVLSVFPSSLSFLLSFSPLPPVSLSCIDSALLCL